MSRTEKGLRFLKIRSLIDLEPLRLSESLRKNLGIGEEKPTRKLIAQLREDLFQEESLTSDMLDKFLKSAYEDIQTSRGIDYDELKKSLAKVSEEGDKYWEAWNSVYRDDIRAHIQHHYVRSMSIQNYDKLLTTLREELDPIVKGYTIISWYNQWTNAVIEAMILTHENVVPTARRIPKVDFFFQDIPLDLKTTFFPKEYYKNVKKKGIAKDMSEAIDYFLADPLDLSQWLYENQGEQRFGDDNRFFIILIDKTNPDSAWKLKSNFSMIEKQVNTYFDEQRSIPEVAWEFSGDRIKGEFQTFSDVLIIFR
jgi:hypothetical protein